MKSAQFYAVEVASQEKKGVKYLFLGQNQAISAVF